MAGIGILTRKPKKKDNLDLHVTLILVADTLYTYTTMFLQKETTLWIPVCFPFRIWVLILQKIWFMSFFKINELAEMISWKRIHSLLIPINTDNSRCLKVEVNLKLLIPQNKFSGPRNLLRVISNHWYLKVNFLVPENFLRDISSLRLQWLKCEEKYW